MTSQLTSLQRSSNNRKSSDGVVRSSSKQESHFPLLPKIVGIHVGSQVEVLAKGGQIQTKELWTTETLVDKLESCIIQAKEPNSLASSSYNRKYLNCATAVITNWSRIEQNNQRHQFVFFLSDIVTNDNRIAAELIDLGHTAPPTLAYVLHKVVERLFELVGASWFYQSASVEIQMRFDP